LFIVRTSELIGVCSFRDINGVHFVGRRSVLDFLNRCEELGHVAWWKRIEMAAANPQTPPSDTPKSESPKTGETKKTSEE
jgi:hypothetical protein